VPLLPPSLLLLPSMSRGLVMVLFFSLGFGAFMFVFALTVQDGLHNDALQGGLAIVPMALLFLVGSLAAPRLITRFGWAALSAGAVVQLAGLASLVTVLVAGTSGVVAGDAGAVGAGLDRDTCGEHLPDRGGRLSRCPAISVRSWLQMASQVGLAGGCGGFSPRPHAELGQDVGHMELHGVLGDV